MSFVDRAILEDLDAFPMPEVLFVNVTLVLFSGFVIMCLSLSWSVIYRLIIKLEWTEPL